MKNILFIADPTTYTMDYLPVIEYPCNAEEENYSFKLIDDVKNDRMCVSPYNARSYAFVSKLVQEDPEAFDAIVVDTTKESDLVDLIVAARTSGYNNKIIKLVPEMGPMPYLTGVFENARISTAIPHKLFDNIRAALEKQAYKD